MILTKVKSAAVHESETVDPKGSLSIMDIGFCMFSKNNTVY